ncbi:siderophore-interacting protein [Mycolicibacterium sp. 050158]|uniref:siderophore-interacting protein n=1 Tax=Mycolicibacterium sp. 050158 TaxID=3090602 RepID=UPI00299E047E|nr:siderophore-interacting protein [Mycolicibacterium sp. 050158]MDX1892199.1 siderophore-interacting protein [Mycolicibacterium sp. 050158]
MATISATVAAVGDAGPRMRRVVLDVPELAQLALPGVGDEAVGIYFPVDGAGDPDGRNYTIRHRGPGVNQLTCDFVLHRRGVASDWVRTATAGDRLTLDHARSWYQPESSTAWQLLIADLSGLPALARILEELPDGMAAEVIVEVADAADLEYLPNRPDVPIVTTVGTGNGRAPSRLTELVRNRTLPAGRGYCWFAGEAQATREVRKYLRGEQGWATSQYDIVGYWRFDSEIWDRRFEAVSEEMMAVYLRALAEGKGDKLAAEEFDVALEQAGL